MRKRVLAYTLLGLLIVGGLTAGLFMDNIQQALMVPGETMMQTNRTPTANPPQQKTPTPGPGSQNQQPTMPAQQDTQQNNVLATDTFQRTNQGLWGLASDGRQWDGDANNQPAFKITDATGQIAQGQNGLNALLGPTKQNVDVTIEGMVNQFGNGVNMGVLLRWTDANNWYKAHIDGSHLKLLRTVNGQGVTLKSVDLQTLPNTPYKLRFRALGAMLFAKVWKSGAMEPADWQIVFSDMSLTTGRVGIRVIVLPETVINILSFKAVVASMGDEV
jgi:hypothetical protein